MKRVWIECEGGREERQSVGAGTQLQHGRQGGELHQGHNSQLTTIPGSVQGINFLRLEVH